MSRDPNLAPTTDALVATTDGATAVLPTSSPGDIPLAPGAVPRIDGFLFVRDWPATSDAREGMGPLTITRDADGEVAMELARHDAETAAYTDRRAVPIGGSTYDALVAALFEPKGEGPAAVAPMTIKSLGTASVDDRPPVCHIITEVVAADGHITTTVEGIGTDNVKTVTAHEPAVAAYLARKAEMMRITAHVADTPG